MGRKLAEVFIADFWEEFKMKSGDRKDLYHDILKISETGRIAPWIINYLHALRTFGNSVVHTSTKPKNYEPTKIRKEDLPILLASILRVLEFWYTMKSKVSS